MFFQHTLTSEKTADIRFAHQLTRRLAGVYKQGVVQGLYPGGNVQVAIAYENNTPTAIATPVISTHHAPSLSLRDLRYQLIEYVMKLAHAHTLQRWRSGEMPFVIAEPCIDVLDQACVSVCPVACIHFDAGKDRKLYIDPNECIDCGACEPVCPVKAIYPDLDLPYKWAKYEEIDALWYRDKEAARAMVDAVKARA